MVALAHRQNPEKANFRSLLAQTKSTDDPYLSPSTATACVLEKFSDVCQSEIRAMALNPSELMASNLRTTLGTCMRSGRLLSSNREASSSFKLVSAIVPPLITGLAGWLTAETVGEIT
jgi:hypothetical protein